MLEGNANYNALISASVLDALYFFVREVKREQKAKQLTTSRGYLPSFKGLGASVNRLATRFG